MIGLKREVSAFFVRDIRSNLVIDKYAQGIKINTSKKYFRKEAKEGIAISIFFVPRDLPFLSHFI